MVVGYGIINLRIPESGSLKSKRSVLNRILKRAQNEFNVSLRKQAILIIINRPKFLLRLSATIPVISTEGGSSVAFYRSSADCRDCKLQNENYGCSSFLETATGIYRSTMNLKRGQVAELIRRICPKYHEGRERPASAFGNHTAFRCRMFAQCQDLFRGNGKDECSVEIKAGLVRQADSYAGSWARNCSCVLCRN